MPNLDQAALLRELGGWGVAIVFMGLFFYVLRVYVRLQDHVLKISTALSATNAKTVESLNAVKDKINEIGDMRGLSADVKDIERKLDLVNERLIELKALGGGG